MSRTKSTLKAKLKAASQEKRIHQWEQHFENLLGKFPKVKDERIIKIISNPLDIKLGEFTQEQLTVVQRKIKNRKAAGIDKIPPRSMENQEI